MFTRNEIQLIIEFGPMLFVSDNKIAAQMLESDKWTEII